MSAIALMRVPLSLAVAALLICPLAPAANADIPSRNRRP
jgi:hypothetical protein